MIVKINTYKSGPFYFSSEYDHDVLRDNLIKAKILFNNIHNIPILPNIASKIEEKLIRKSIFGTAAIEGNPLSENDVDKVLSQKEIDKKINSSEQQIVNLKKVYDLIKLSNLNFDRPFLLDEKIIKDFHSLITFNSEEHNIPGKYRNEIVKVGDSEHGGIYTPPKIIEDIKKLIKEFILWINSKQILAEDEALRAALAHYHFALIHPFGNGNGRTARAIEALLLKSAGIKFVPHMLSNFYYNNIDEYFLVFSKSERDKKHNITSFLEFYLKGLVISLEELQSTIFWWIRRLTLREFYTQLRQKNQLTQRQFDFLILLLEFPTDFYLKDLFDKDKFKIVYRNVTERTARRDIKALHSKKLILPKENGKFSLNFMALG